MMDHRTISTRRLLLTFLAAGILLSVVMLLLPSHHGQAGHDCPFCQVASALVTVEPDSAVNAASHDPGTPLAAQSHLVASRNDILSGPTRAPPISFS